MTRPLPQLECHLDQFPSKAGKFKDVPTIGLTGMTMQKATPIQRDLRVYRALFAEQRSLETSSSALQTMFDSFLEVSMHTTIPYLKYK